MPLVATWGRGEWPRLQEGGPGEDTAGTQLRVIVVAFTSAARAGTDFRPVKDGKARLGCTWLGPGDGIVHQGRECKDVDNLMSRT